MEVLWDTIYHDETVLDPPVWHKKVLAERTQELESGNAELLTIEELKDIKH